jgi:DNA-binding CsgD family transcriptional regulator
VSRESTVAVIGDRATAEAFVHALRRRGVPASVADPVDASRGTLLVLPGFLECVPPASDGPGSRMIAVTERPVRSPHGAPVECLATSGDLDHLAEVLVSSQPTGGGREPRADELEEDPLTPREREVLTALAAGKGTNGIAAELSISKHTVRTHLQNAMGKLNVQNRVELIAWALRSGGLESPTGRTS